MSHPRQSLRDSIRAWLSGLAITLTTIVSYLAFWRLSPGVTFLIGGAALATLLTLLWKERTETRD